MKLTATEKQILGINRIQLRNTAFMYRVEKLSDFYSEDIEARLDNIKHAQQILKEEKNILRNLLKDENN